MVKITLMIVGILSLIGACITYYFISKDLKKSIKEYERVVKEYKDFINKFYE